MPARDVTSKDDRLVRNTSICRKSMESKSVATANPQEGSICLALAKPVGTQAGNSYHQVYAEILQVTLLTGDHSTSDVGVIPLEGKHKPLLQGRLWKYQKGVQTSVQLSKSYNY